MTLMHAFEVLGDPVRRRILEMLATGESLSGHLADRIHAEFGISPPAVSQHLKVLREGGFAAVERDGPRRRYSLGGGGFAEVDAWLWRVRAFWGNQLDALEREIDRGAPPNAAADHPPESDEER